MQLLGKRGKKKAGPFGTVRNFVSVVREVRFDEVRAEAERAPRLLVLAPDEADARAAGETLIGNAGPTHLATGRLGAGPLVANGYDVVVVFDPHGPTRAEDVATSIASGATGTPVVAFEGTDPRNLRAARTVRESVLARLPERAPSFGRHIPAFRAAAVEAVVSETAKANAQFALVANIPAVIPIVGSLASAGADFLVLTKNQVMMIYKIAAAHGRDLHDQAGILRELIPVVGAGLFWRTVAREAASFLPLAAGTVPKVVIAYTGTVAVGRAADFYYRAGRKPTRDQMRDYYRQAAEALKKLPLPIPGGGESNARGDS
jgi:uncharacterized protein (DUF697 family)